MRIRAYTLCLSCYLHLVKCLSFFPGLVFQMSLDITRNFVENRDGTYDLYEVPKVDVENVEDGKINKQMPIRPFELKTYLKVGMYIVYEH